MTHSVVLLLALTVLLGAAAGCCSRAHRTDGDVLDIADLAKDFWAVQTEGSPVRVIKPRVAVVEFTVQYGGGMGNASDFGASLRLELPGLLYGSFDQELAAIERYLVPLEEMADSTAYTELAGTSLDELATAVMTRTEPEPDDGPIRYPVDGLRSLDAAQEEFDAKLRAVARELEADYALQVRLRVGVVNGKGAILDGSVLRSVSDQGTVELRSTRTLVAPSSVVEQGGAVNTSRFIRSVQRLLRPHLGLAIVAVEAWE